MLTKKEARERMFDVAHVCRTLHISYRQLDYWCRCRMVPVRSGGQRRFTEGDVQRLRIIRDLLSVGCGLSEIRRVLDGTVSTGWLLHRAQVLNQIADELLALSPQKTVSGS